MPAHQSLNVVYRAHMKAGWIGIFTGESQGAVLERVIPELNERGYRVVFIVRDKFSVARYLLNLLLLVVTLGFYGHAASLLIVGEKVAGNEVAGNDE